MKIKVLALVVFLPLFSLKAQQKQKDLSENLVSKGTFFAGLSMNGGFGFTMPERSFILLAHVKPRIGYFILDRFSVGLSYQGTGFSSPTAPRYRMFHNIEADLNYYFYAHKNLFLYSQTGILYQEYMLPNVIHRKSSDLHLKLGIGATWRLKNLPNFGINVEANYYLSPGPRIFNQKFPTLNVGFSYFFNRKSNTSKKQKLQSGF